MVPEGVRPVHLKGGPANNEGGGAPRPRPRPSFVAVVASFTSVTAVVANGGANGGGVCHGSSRFFFPAAKPVARTPAEGVGVVHAQRRLPGPQAAPVETEGAAAAEVRARGRWSGCRRRRRAQAAAAANLVTGADPAALAAAVAGAGGGTGARAPVPGVALEEHPPDAVVAAATPAVRVLAFTDAASRGGQQQLEAPQARVGRGVRRGRLLGRRRRRRRAGGGRVVAVEDHRGLGVGRELEEAEGADLEAVLAVGDGLHLPQARLLVGSQVDHIRAHTHAGMGGEIQKGHGGEVRKTVQAVR